MTNAEKIRNLSNYELAETYINVLELRSPEGHRVSYQSKHFGQIFYVKEEAIKAELDWLGKDVKKITNAEKIRNMNDKELADFFE